MKKKIVMFIEMVVIFIALAVSGFMLLSQAGKP